MNASGSQMVVTEDRGGERLTSSGFCETLGPGKRSGERLRKIPNGNMCLKQLKRVQLGNCDQQGRLSQSILRERLIVTK